ncbi:MAG: GtrA family protein, partial [Pseudomonadota bacterium]
MTFISAEEAFKKAEPGSLSTTSRVWLAALLGTLVFALIQFATYTPDGFPNNDNLLRMIHVQDLLAGQGWYDPVQYRLGLEGGTVMHWSKLIDAPIAALVLVGGKAFAAAAWPGLLAFVALAGLVLGAVRTGGTETILPASVIGVAALWSVGAFSIGAFDHHNVHVVLLIWGGVRVARGPAPGG